MARLRNGGIYRLPCGTRFVAREMVAGGRYDLLTTSNLAWSPSEGAYKAEPDGGISLSGNRTHWNVSDLIDTGQTMQTLATGA